MAMGLVYNWAYGQASDVYTETFLGMEWKLHLITSLYGCLIQRERLLGLLQVPGGIMDHSARKLDNLECSLLREVKTLAQLTLSFIFHVPTQDWFETAVISFFKLFGENYDYELLTKREECERLVGLYNVCETNKLSDCDYHLERRPEGCSDFNKGEY
ncbi:hypothetical protein CsSME_00032678 [Camellia sinensis var. sinensis]